MTSSRLLAGVATATTVLAVLGWAAAFKQLRARVRLERQGRRMEVGDLRRQNLR